MGNRKPWPIDFCSQAACVSSLGSPVVEFERARWNILGDLVLNPRLNTPWSTLAGNFIFYLYLVARVPAPRSHLRHRRPRRSQRLFHLHGDVIERSTRGFFG